MMKFLIITLMSLLFITNVNARQGEPEGKNNLLNISMTRLFLSNMTLSYERLFQSSGISVSAGITLKDNRNESREGVNFELQYRLYPRLNTESTFQGMYLAPYVMYRFLDRTNRNECGYYSESFGCFPTISKGTYNIYGVGVVFGMKIAIARKLVFTYELGGGLKYSEGNKQAGSYDIFHPGYTGVAPKADISLGYFF